jgi:hypothetical protein
VDRPLSQLVTASVVIAMLVSSAGATCVLSLTAVHVPAVACHHARVPSNSSSNPQPADHQCCTSNHRSALVSRIFSPRPALQPVKVVNAFRLLADARERSAFSDAPWRSGGPAFGLILRI